MFASLRTRMLATSPSQRLLWLLWLIALIDSCGVGLIVPTIPYFGKRLGATSSLQGLLGTTYGLLQLIGGPIMGRLSDSAGRKWVLIMSLTGALLSYYLMASANSIPLLFFSRLPVGLLKQTESTSFAIVSDLTTPEERTRFLGYVQSASGIGFIIGPALSGILSGSLSLEWPVYASCCLFLIAILLASLLPKNLRHYAPGILISADGASTHPESRAESLETADKTVPVASKLGFFASLLHQPGLKSCLAVHLAVTFATMLFQTNFMLIMEELGLPAKQAAFMMSYMAIISVFASSVVLRFLTHRFSETTLISRSIVVVGASLLLFPLMPSVTGVMVTLVPFVISVRVLKSCLMSRVTSRVSKDKTGGVLGLANSVEAACRALAPIIGGALIQSFGSSSPAMLGSIAVFFAAGYVEVSGCFC